MQPSPSATRSMPIPSSRTSLPSVRRSCSPAHRRRWTHGWGVSTTSTARSHGTTTGSVAPDAGAALVAADTSFTVTLPCLQDEPCVGGIDGQNVVRSADGIHFCPSNAEADRGVTGECPVWSSGAHRYGHTLAAPVFEQLDTALVVSS